jgi:hypothetical protein
MFDENSIEEFGVKSVEQCAKKNNMEYTFKSAATCKCAGLEDVINRKVCKSMFFKIIRSI